MTSSWQKLRIIVQGYVIRWPLGGMVWSNMHYLLGLAQLGHEVWFIEDSDDIPLCYDPDLDVTSEDPSYGLGFAQRMFDRIGLPDRWAYWDQHTQCWRGAAADHIVDVLRDADLLLNLAGRNLLRPWLMSIPHRCFVDEDPAFTQVRHLTEPGARELALRHTSFVSFGENIGRGTSDVPDDGLPWRATRQPLALEALRPMPPMPDGRYTTVMKLDSYAAREYAGVRYALKSDSTAQLMDLPRRSPAVLELAAAGPKPLRRQLVGAGWRIVDPRPISRDPWTYENYIAESKAEFGIAKHGYVVSRSGWFSERTCAYLGIGRPAIVEDTGLSDLFPTGDGLLLFDSTDSALAAITAVETDYEHHCRAAYEFAHEHFDARSVLPRLLDDAMRPATVTTADSELRRGP